MEFSRILPENDHPFWEEDTRPPVHEKSFMDMLDKGIDKVGDFLNTSIKVGSKIASGLEWAAALLGEADPP